MNVKICQLIESVSHMDWAIMHFVGIVAVDIAWYITLIVEALDLKDHVKFAISWVFFPTLECVKPFGEIKELVPDFLDEI